MKLHQAFGIFVIIKVKINAQKIITVEDTTFAVAKGKPEKIPACWDSILTSQYQYSTPTNNIELASQLEVIFVSTKKERKKCKEDHDS